MTAAAKTCCSEECDNRCLPGLRVCGEHHASPDGLCVVLGCTEEVEGRHSMCSTHRRRMQRGMDTASLTAPVRERSCRSYESAGVRLEHAAVHYADCDAEDDAAFERARRALYRAARALADKSACSPRRSCFKASRYVQHSLFPLAGYQ